MCFEVRITYRLCGHSHTWIKYCGPIGVCNVRKEDGSFVQCPPERMQQEIREKDCCCKPCCDVLIDAARKMCDGSFTALAFGRAAGQFVGNAAAEAEARSRAEGLRIAWSEVVERHEACAGERDDNGTGWDATEPGYPYDLMPCSTPKIHGTGYQLNQKQA
jgi:hypothetical protein